MAFGFIPMIESLMVIPYGYSLMVIPDGWFLMFFSMVIPGLRFPWWLIPMIANGFIPNDLSLIDSPMVYPDGWIVDDFIPNG